MTKPRFSKAVYWLTIGFMFLPFLVLMVYSFNSSKSFTFTGFSLRWYEELFGGGRKADHLWLSVQNSLIIAFGAASISTIIGTLGAIGINWYRFVYKRYVQTMSFIPLVLPEAIIEAARDLGAREHQILMKVVLPISMPGILSGFLTSFILSLEDFVVTLFVKGGTDSDTLPIYVFSIIRKDTPMMVAAFSVFLILFTVILTLSVRKLVKYIVKSS